MTGRSGLHSLFAKEARALLLPAAAPMAVILGAQIAPKSLDGVAVAAYMIGASGIGAMSVGHEYTSRTLPLLLTLPVPRQRLLMVKWAVVAALLGVLAVTATVSSELRDMSGRHEGFVGFLPIACALFIAPWLTMACRSPLAGTVFAMVPVGTLLTAGALIGWLVYGPDADAKTRALQLTLMWRGTLIACAAGAGLTWRSFMRLEAAEPSTGHIAIPAWRRRTTAAAATRRSHPVVGLAVKELRLHQLLPSIAGMYVLGWLIALTASRVRPESTTPAEIFSVLSIVYSGFMFILAGSVASAEERYLGTLDSQLLLPISSATQWAVKLVVPAGLAIALGLVLPILLIGTLSPVAIRFPHLQSALVAPLALFGISVYVSSNTRSSMRALLVAVVAIFAIAFISAALLRWTTPWQWVPHAPIPYHHRLTMAVTSLIALRGGTEALIIGACTLLLLHFALTCHRSADLSWRRIASHVLWTAAVAFGGAALLALSW